VTPLARRLSQTAAYALLRTASALVPRRQRTEWLAEWRAELWHVCHEDKNTWPAIAFSAGAFRDALYFRSAGDSGATMPTAPRGSAARCLGALLIGAFVGLVICLALPNAHEALLQLHSRNSDSVWISGDGYHGVEIPTVRIADYRQWTAETHRLFTELAFYQPAVKRIHVDHYDVNGLSIARSSPNLMDFIDLPLTVKDAIRNRSSALPQLFLTEKTWQQSFHRDPNLIGRGIEVGGQRVTVAGILPNAIWPFPSQIDAWLPENQTWLDSLGARTKGFVIAFINPSGIAAAYGPRWFMTVPGPERSFEQFDCIALSEIFNLPRFILVYTLILAIAALPATTPVPLGEYPSHSNPSSQSASYLRWVFLVAKLALVVSAVCFWSIAIAYCVNPVGSSFSIYILIALSFTGFLLAFRWAWQDQRRRCPVCLRLLSNPARVGQASRNFLAWNGTEWICSQGHGLLHVPELSTSWRSSQCWLYLDPSWRSLFAGSYSRPSSMR
jgi:hypothetical protein